MNIWKSPIFKHLSGDMLAGKPEQTLTITYCRDETLVNQHGSQDKTVLYFQELSKGLILNKTNIKTLVNVFGSDETEDWRGQKITLFTELIKVAGEYRNAIRLKALELGETQAVQFVDDIYVGDESGPKA